MQSKKRGVIIEEKGERKQIKDVYNYPNSHTRTIYQPRSYFRRVEILILVIFKQGNADSFLLSLCSLTVGRQR